MKADFSYARAGSADYTGSDNSIEYLGNDKDKKEKKEEDEKDKKDKH